MIGSVARRAHLPWLFALSVAAITIGIGAMLL